MPDSASPAAESTLHASSQSIPNVPPFSDSHADVSVKPPEGFALGATDLLLLLMATIWGVNYSAVKYATQFLPPASFTAVRLVAAAASMFIVVAFQGRPLPSRRDITGLMLLGVIGNGIYQLLFSNGVARTRIADAALIVASAPAFIAIASRLRGIERIHVRAACGIVLSILGVGIVIAGTTAVQQRQGSLLGTTLMVGAVLCWSTFTVALRPYALRVDGVQLNAFTMLGGLLPMLFVSHTLVTTPWTHVAPLVWGCVLYAGVISMGIAYLFYMRGLRALGPTRTSIYGNLQPLVAILVAWALLGELPTAWQAVGALLIVSGILLTRM